MNKILSFLKQSNRYKHLVGGFIVGLPVLTPYAAIYAAAIAASCLELKDWLRGGRWDWVDWLLTMVGGGIAALIFLIIQQEDWLLSVPL